MKYILYKIKRYNPITGGLEARANLVDQSLATRLLMVDSGSKRISASLIYRNDCNRRAKTYKEHSKYLNKTKLILVCLESLNVVQLKQNI